MKNRLRFFAVVALALVAVASASNASAAGFVETAADPTVLYDGPSDKAAKRFVMPPATPLETVSSLPAWTKVRDVEGSINWVRSADLVAARHLIARDVATIRQAASENSDIRFRVARGVLLERLGDRTGGGWFEVRHEGTSGFVRASEVWGN